MKAYSYNSPYPAKEKLAALKCLKLPNASIIRVANRYHVTRQTVYRRRRIYNGTLASLENKSCVPHTLHPNRHTDAEIKHILDLLRRNPHIGLNELYGKLRFNFGYSRNPVSLYRWLLKNNYYLKPVKPKKKYVPKPYETPLNLGEKWQIDVKVVPKPCYADGVFWDCKFYQYTVIDEASRERFIYAYNEQSGFSSKDFLYRAINYFRYKPKIIQTDNGSEFNNIVPTDKKHIFDLACEALRITHKKIKPRTPRHNGKVERSHRTDNERFYNLLKFYSFDDLQIQMSAYLKRSNNIPMSVLYPRGGRKSDWLTPLQKRTELLLLDGDITE